MQESSFFKKVILATLVKSQKLPRGYYETKKCVLFFALSRHHTGKAMKHTQNWRNEHD